jgi:hypothetical protein
MPKPLEIKNKANIPLSVRVLIELGDCENRPDDETVKSVNSLLSDIKNDFRFGK